MDFEEELDIDALADLLEGEEIAEEYSGCDQINSESKALDESTHPVDKSDAFLACSQNVAKSSPPKSTKKLPSQTSIDLFSTESSSITDKPCPDNADNNNPSVVHSGEADDSSDDENKTYLTETGKMIKKRIALRKSFEEKPKHRTIKTWKDEKPNYLLKPNSVAPKESYAVDEFSGLRIINPLVPHNVMKTRMEGRRMIKMSYIQSYMRSGDIEGDWVTIGVVVNKLPPKTSKTGKTYSIWKMCDLHNTDKIISVFLFGAVHAEHWKTAIGSVVGILNPSFLPNRDSSKSTDICLSIDQPGKFMMMGTAKDFGHCRAVKKDGFSCTSIVNKSLCEYCTYHISKEYRKLSSKRIELQSSYSGRQPVNLKKKVLNGQGVMYGGQLFSSPAQKASTNSRNPKDKLTLNNLGLKRKAEEMVNSQLTQSSNAKLSEVHGIEIDKEISSESKFINQQLARPSTGSKNLFRHLVNANNAEIAKQKVAFVTPKELLKMHEMEMKQKRARLEMQKAGNDHQRKEEGLVKSRSSASLHDLSPQLGRGFKPGDEICLDARPSSSNKTFLQKDLNKMKAIKKIQQNGPIKQINPNAVKNSKTADSVAKIKLSVDKDIESASEKKSTPSPKQPDISKSVLGSIDLSSDKVRRILGRKSNHAFELELEELDKQDRYFTVLEKKEQMEEKMASTMEVVCDVVSCVLCKYTAPKATERCKDEGHPLRCHKASKRFFSCKNCKHRTCAFTKLPTRPCRNCGELNFERTGMLKPRSGPKLESEILNIRGDEMKFLNS